uniref:(northern house mosquito) hypothetical protein n=1 Tax=Culex pipiens TaxID=7175 RepID=A0A8D8CKA2_CULPI
MMILSVLSTIFLSALIDKNPLKFKEVLDYDTKKKTTLPKDIVIFILSFSHLYLLHEIRFTRPHFSNIFVVNCLVYFQMHCLNILDHRHFGRHLGFSISNLDST